MTETALTTTHGGQVATVDIDAAFADFLRLRVAEGDASPHTVNAYRRHVGAFAAWCAGHGVKPDLATAGDIERYRRDLIDAGRYERSTIGAKLQAVTRFYTAMQWRGLRPDNPAAGVRAPRERTDKAERVKFLPLPGLQRVLLLPETGTPTGARDRAAMLLMGMHGLRVAEVAALDLADVDVSAEPGRVVIRHGKGDKMRMIYLTPKTAAAVRSWVAMRPATASPALFIVLDSAQHGKDGRGQERIPGGRLSVRNLRTRIDGYLQAAGLKADGVSCHSLRHSFATWATYGGASLTAVSASLGHASLTTTGTYAKVADKIKQNPAAYLERLLDVSD